MFEDGAHGEFGAREHHQQKRDVSHTFYNVRLLLKPPLLMTINIKGLDPPNSHLFFTPQKKNKMKPFLVIETVTQITTQSSMFCGVLYDFVEDIIIVYDGLVFPSG